MDNHHVAISNSQISCGVVELSRLESDPHKVLYALASHLYHPSRGQPAAFAIWSDVNGSNGQNLLTAINDWVMKKKYFNLTVPMVTQPVENPRTSNPIFVAVWEIPHEEFRKWYKEEKVRRIKSA